jgi:ATP phosphoribosyltransferase
LINLKTKDYVNIALPKGKLLPSTSCLLDKIGLGFINYAVESRMYRLESKKQESIKGKVFQDRDIPVQVAIGNYDMGICGLDSIEELTAKYPSSPIIKIADLEYDPGSIYLATSRYSKYNCIDDLVNRGMYWRLVTEFPNIAESVLLSLRVPKFKIFPVKGAAEAYVPENADMVIIRGEDEAEIKSKNLIPIKLVLNSSAYLIANKKSMQSKDMSRIISLFSKGLQMKSKSWLKIEIEKDKYKNGSRPETGENKVWLAIPDGHQQKPTTEYLKKCSLILSGYAGEQPNRRPKSNLDWLSIKVIRPQDMPMQVANGNFDIAVTGVDWYTDHIYQFPSSPVVKLFDLDYSGVRIVAVVDGAMPANTIDQVIQLVNTDKLGTLRVASEYINIADRYLHNKRISKYKIVPTSGATEALLPEDADMIIENTQTGKTLEAHKLKIVDTLFTSTACIIGNRNSMKKAAKKDRIKQLITMLEQGTIKS